MARRSRYGDDDAFGRGTHKAGVSAQIEAGLIRFKTRKDHRRLAVRAEGTLAGSFAMEKRRDGTIEHTTLPLVGRERNTLSVTDRCRYRAVMVPLCASGSLNSGQYCSLSEISHWRALSSQGGTLAGI